MGKSLRRLIMGAGAIVAVALLLTLGVMAQIDPRNDSEEYFDAVNDAQCYEHHLEDGFVPFGFRFDEAYSQLPIGEVVPIKVQIRHITDYMGPHTVEDMTVTVNTEEARNVEVVTDDLPEPIAQAWEEDLQHGEGIDSGDLFLGTGATEGRLSARVTEIDPPVHDLGVYGELELNADGRVSAPADNGEVNMDLGEDFFDQRGRGNYTFGVVWRAPQDLISDHFTATVEMNLWVNFTQEGTEFTYPASTPVLRTADPPDETEIEIPVRITSAEPALLDFRIRANAFWEHDAGDGAPLDEGTYVRFMTMEVEGGDELIVARQFQAPTPVGDVVNVYNLITRLLGFIGLFLIVAAMFTGGVFGKKSRRWMNKFTGGAKKRVLWHSAMGFLIVLVATVHFSFALIETRHDIARGLLWGGLAWALLISLGFTGYYQVRMIKKWNYRVWKHVHLWSAVAVLFFVLVHAILEGSDWKPVLDLLPDQVERLIWPRV